MPPSAEHGQAQIEAVAAIVVLLLSAAVAVKAVAAVGSVLVADAATHAGALAQAAGGDGVVAARRALPGSLRRAARVRMRDGEIRGADALRRIGGVVAGAGRMIAAAVTGVHRRADAVACCAALALGEGEGGSRGPAIVIGAGATRPRPGLLASAPARELEELIGSAAIDGVTVVARGYLCLIATTAELGPEVAKTVGEVSAGSVPLVASVGPSDLERWSRQLTIVRADLPADRDLLAVLAAALGDPSRIRVDKLGPGRIGSRRALAGLVPGRTPHARYLRICR